MKVAIMPDWTKNLMKFGLEVGHWLKDNYSVLPTWGFERDMDIAVLLGGDGFIMRTSLDIAGYKIPFLAINCGTTGFLAVAENDNWQEVLGKVIGGKYTVEKRPILTVNHFHREEAQDFEVAGNVYIRHKADMILVSVNIDDKPVYRELRGDGIIVANATGATAYNLAANGALISSGLVITPICTHALNVKSLPVPESAKIIEITYHGRKSSYDGDEGCLLHLDSGRHPIWPGDRIRIRKSQKEASFIIPEGFSFIESLQKKLGLST